MIIIPLITVIVINFHPLCTIIITIYRTPKSSHLSVLVLLVVFYSQALLEQAKPC